MKAGNYIAEINQLCHCEALQGYEQGGPKQTRRVLIKATSLLRRTCALSNSMLHAMTFCLLLSVSALAQSRDSTRKDTGRFLHYKHAKSNIDSSERPLIVIDGVIYKGELNSISPDDIMDVTVLKGNTATALYGSKAAAGAILIKTKKPGNILNVHKDTSAKYTMGEPGSMPYPTKPLIVLDGVIYKEDIKTIDPNIIESIDVYKGAKAEALYGLKAAAGAILITTKKHHKLDTIWLRGNKE